MRAKFVLMFLFKHSFTSLNSDSASDLFIRHYNKKREYNLTCRVICRETMAKHQNSIPATFFFHGEQSRNMNYLCMEVIFTP